MTTQVRKLWLSLKLNIKLALRGLGMWTVRQKMVALAAGLAFALVIGVATVLIPNQIFARDIPPVWWNYPVWLVTSALSGVLVGTYIRSPLGGSSPAVASEQGKDLPSSEKQDGEKPGNEASDVVRSEQRTSRMGMAGGVLAWFAVGCPVCNKLALLALGYSGAITWFTPLQPFLAAGALGLTAVAVVIRLRGQVACPVSGLSAAVAR